MYLSILLFAQTSYCFNISSSIPSLLQDNITSFDAHLNKLSLVDSFNTLTVFKFDTEDKMIELVPYVSLNLSAYFSSSKLSILGITDYENADMNIVISDTLEYVVIERGHVQKSGPLVTNLAQKAE